jgi:hypothetical protein
MSHAKETLTLNTALQSEPVKPEITPQRRLSHQMAEDCPDTYRDDYDL